MEKDLKEFSISDSLWAKIETQLPRYQTSHLGGRPRVSSLRPITEGILYKLRTGCQWKSLPRPYGNAATVHRYFKQWIVSGVLDKVWALAMQEHRDSAMARGRQRVSI